jgi:type IV secretion system protein TrbL
MNLLNMHILALDYGPDLLNDVANQYIKAINNGFGLIRGDVTHLLNVLIILSIIWSAAMWAVSEDQVVIQFARKVIYIGFFAWIIQNWQGLTDKLALSFMQLGLKAGGFEGVGYYTQQPGNIAYLGYTTAQPMLDQIKRLTGPVAFFKNFPEIVFLFVAFVAILGSFCVITVQVVLALLMFKFGTLAAFVLVPFAVLSKTAFIAERPLGWVVGSGIRLMVLTLVLGVGNGVFQSLKIPAGATVTTYQAFSIALAAILLMVLSLVASRLATDLVIGGPSLGVGTAVNTMAVAYNTAHGAATSRPSLMAVKAAANVAGKGLSMGASLGKTVIGKVSRGRLGGGSSGSGSGNSGSGASGTVGAASASKTPMPKGSGGTGAKPSSVTPSRAATAATPTAPTAPSTSSNTGSSGGNAASGSTTPGGTKP